MTPAVITMSGAPTQSELERRLLARWRYANNYRQQWDDRAIEWYKLYVGYREALSPDKEGRSNLHIPRPYEQIDALRSRIVKSFFGTRPYVDFLPVPSGPGVDRMHMQQNEVNAQIAAGLVDSQLERNDILRKWYDYVTSFLIFPAAIQSVGWRYEERDVRRRIERPILQYDPWSGQIVPVIDPMTGRAATQLVWVESVEPVWDDNEILNVDYFDFWADPRGYDIDSCRYVYQREWVTLDRLEERMALLESVGSGQPYLLDMDRLKESPASLDEGKWERLSAVGLTQQIGSDDWEEGEEPGTMVELLHYWTDDEYGILVNRQQVVWHGENPYWRHGKKPYIVSSFDPLPNELYGMSAMQVIEHLSHELNTLRNQRIDNVSFVLNRMWKKRRGADIDDSELVSRPHGVLELDNMDDVQPLEMPDITRSAYQEEGIVKTDMEHALGVAPVVRGVEASRAQTATEVAQQTTAASIRFDTKIALYEVMGLKRLSYLMDMNNQQFIDRPRLVKLYGEEESWDWHLAQPGQLIGEHDYRPAGAAVDPAANKEIRRAQLTQMIQAVWNLNIPYFDRAKLVKAWAESFDLRNVEGMMFTEEELFQQFMAFQQQQMMQQMGAAGGMPGMPQAPPMGPGMAQLPPGGPPMLPSPPMMG